MLNFSCGMGSSEFFYILFSLFLSVPTYIKARHYENLFAVESEIDATTEAEADEGRSKRRKKQPDYFVRGKTVSTRTKCI